MRWPTHDDHGVRSPWLARGRAHIPSSSMSEHANTPNEPGNDRGDEKQFNQIAELAESTQDAISRLQGEFPPQLQRDVDHMEAAIEQVADWADEATDADALAGASVIIEAEQIRIADLQTQVGSGNEDVRGKLEAVENRLDALGDAISDLDISTVAYVIYVNSQFVARYYENSVKVETILEDAGREDPSELGLFPLDEFDGDRQTDQAFPADKDLNLNEDYRTFFRSTSDGGKIA